MKVKIGNYLIPEIPFRMLNGSAVLYNNYFIGGALKVIKRGKGEYHDIIAIDKIRPHTLFDIMLAFSNFEDIEVIENTKVFTKIFIKAIEIVNNIKNIKFIEGKYVDSKSVKLIYNVSSKISNDSAMSVPAFHLHINTFSDYELKKIKVVDTNLQRFDGMLEKSCNEFEAVYPKKIIGITESKKRGLAIGLNLVTSWNDFSEINCFELAIILKKIHLLMIKNNNSHFNYGISIYRNSNNIIILIQPKYGTSIGAAGAMNWQGIADIAIPERGSGTFDKNTIVARRIFQKNILKKF